MEPVKGSREISLKNAALRQSRPHRVSFLSSASYTPTSLDGVSLDSRVASLPYESSPLAHPAPLRGPLLHGKASHLVLRSLSLPYKPRSLATLKGTQDVTGLPSCCINHTKHSADLATGVATPLSRFAGLPPRESVSLGSQVALLPYEPSSLATPQAGAQQPAGHLLPISCTKCRAARISPSGGDAAEGGRRGAFPSRCAHSAENVQVSRSWPIACP